MSRDRAPFVAQGTWRSGALHVWGWNGESPASAAWLYSGFGRGSRWSGDGGWHDSPISYGELSRIDLMLPSGGRRSVPSVRLDPFGAAVWLSDTPGGDELSPSLAWFESIVRFAAAIVNAGRVTPVVVDEGPFTAKTSVDALKGFTQSARFKQCFVRQLFRHYAGREELPADHPLLKQLFLRFAKDDRQGLVELLELLAGSQRLSQRQEIK